MKIDCLFVVHYIIIARGGNGVVVDIWEFGVFDYGGMIVVEPHEKDGKRGGISSFAPNFRRSPY